MTKPFDKPEGKPTKHTADNYGSRTRWSDAEQIRASLGLPATATPEEIRAAWDALCDDNKLDDSSFKSPDLPKDHEHLENEIMDNKSPSKQIASTAIGDLFADQNRKLLPYDQTPTGETIMADPKTYDAYNK